MYGDGTNVVRVRLKGSNLLGGVVVVYSQLEIVGAADDPVLSRNEAPGSDGHVCELEGFDNRLLIKSESPQNPVISSWLGELACVSYDHM
jgi:hypothetical protein